MRVHVVSMGCPKNTVDTEASLGLLERAGCVAVGDPQAADLLVVNACSFLECAWQETIEELRELARLKDRHPSKRLVLMGCLPLHRGRSWQDSLPFVDHFLPAGAHAGLLAIVESLRSGRRLPRWPDVGRGDPFAGAERRPRITPSHLAYVKIAEGCDRACRFCAIPAIRGPMRSRSVESIVREVETLAAEGVKEICLVAQDTTAYADGRKTLPDLVDAVVATGIEWVRLFYVYPTMLTLGLARRLFAHASVCRYLEVPVQHASDRVLRAMGRGYTRKELEQRLSEIRAEFPDVVLRSEVIVGHPGERDEDFAELRDFVETIEFASLGVFAYSAEPGTEAASLGDRVPSHVAAERAAEIADIQRSVTFGFLSQEAGKKHRVLVDRAIEGEGGGRRRYAGRYYGQAYEIDGEVYVDAERLAVGEFATVRVTGADAFDLEAVAE